MIWFKAPGSSQVSFVLAGGPGISFASISVCVGLQSSSKRAIVDLREAQSVEVSRSCSSMEIF